MLRHLLLFALALPACAHTPAPFDSDERAREEALQAAAIRMAWEAEELCEEDPPRSAACADLAEAMVRVDQLGRLNTRATEAWLVAQQYQARKKELAELSQLAGMVRADYEQAVLDVQGPALRVIEQQGALVQGD